jgi:hypothetical protein
VKPTRQSGEKQTTLKKKRLPLRAVWTSNKTKISSSSFIKKKKKKKKKRPQKMGLKKKLRIKNFSFVCFTTFGVENLPVRGRKTKKNKEIVLYRISFKVIISQIPQAL